MKLPLKPDGQWPRTVAKKKVVLIHSYGPQNNDKVKEPAKGGDQRLFEKKSFFLKTKNMNQGSIW